MASATFLKPRSIDAERRLLHDMRHLLACMEMSVSHLAQQVGQASLPGARLNASRAAEMREQLSAIEHSSRLASHVVSRPERRATSPEAERQVAQLSNALSLALNSVRPMVPVGCAVAVRVPELPMVRGNERDLATVLFNLLLGASESIRRKPGIAGLIQVTAECGSQAIRLSVRDNGAPKQEPGAPHDRQPMGLAICHEILGDVGGNLELYATRSGGCIAQVWLQPAAR